jgi:hypothetical protein
VRANEEPVGRVALAVGPFMAVTASGLLELVRDSFGVANVALVLSGVVVVASLAGRAAGLTTAVIAALSYNFFHTKPYHSLRIDAWRDIATVALLVVIGVIVSEMAAWRRRAVTAAGLRLQAARALERVAAKLAAAAPAEEVWDEVRAAMIGTLDLADCRYEPGTAPSVALLPRTGSLFGESMRWGGSGFELPRTGAAIAVSYAGTTFGHIVLVPAEGVGSTRDIRQAAVALADEYAVALSQQPLAR